MLPNCLEDTGSSQKLSVLIENDCNLTWTNTHYDGTTCASFNLRSRFRAMLTLSDWQDLITGSSAQLTVKKIEVTQLSAAWKADAISQVWYGLTDWLLGAPRDVTGLDPGIHLGDPKLSVGDHLYTYIKQATASDANLKLSAQFYSILDQVPASPTASEITSYPALLGLQDCVEIAGTYRDSCTQSGGDYRIMEVVIGEACLSQFITRTYSDSSCTSPWKIETRTLGLQVQSGSFTSSGGATTMVALLKSILKYTNDSAASFANTQSHYGFNDWIADEEKEITGAEPGAGSGVSGGSRSDEGDLLGGVSVYLDTSTSPPQLHFDSMVLDQVE